MEWNLQLKPTGFIKCKQDLIFELIVNVYIVTVLIKFVIATYLLFMC